MGDPEAIRIAGGAGAPSSFFAGAVRLAHRIELPIGVFFARSGLCANEGGLAMRAARKAFLTGLLAIGGLFSTGGPALADGTIVAWGWNYWGQCNVPAPNSDFGAVAACNCASVGLRSSGTIAVWGSCQSHPCDLPSPNDGFVALSLGAGHGLALRPDSTLVAWGDNTFGQCDVPSPNSGFVAMTAGERVSLGVKTPGCVTVWGSNEYGQCDVPAPNSGFVAVSVGIEHCLGLKGDGSVIAWGGNAYGQCDVPEPNSGFVAISAGTWHSLGLRNDGSVVAWGWCDQGECAVPEPNSGFTAVSGGAGFSLGLREDGSVAGWGGCGSGECNPPAPNSGFTAIAAGGYHSLGLRNSLLGGCCRPDGYCTVTTEEWCLAPSVWQGSGSVCVPRPCPPSSAVSGAVDASRLGVYPNPAPGLVRIELGVSAGSVGSVEILDKSGRLIRRLAIRSDGGDGFSLVWDGRDERGREMPNGVYFVKAATAGGVRTGTAVRRR